MVKRLFMIDIKLNHVFDEKHSFKNDAGKNFD